MSHVPSGSQHVSIRYVILEYGIHKLIVIRKARREFKMQSACPLMLFSYVNLSSEILKKTPREDRGGGNDGFHGVDLVHGA